jgi:hypothetical protein
MTERIIDPAKLLEKIRSRGFWEIIIRPLNFEEERIKDLSKCRDIVEKSNVRLRGWNYPHVGTRNPPYYGMDYVEGVVDWDIHKEFWRMFQSGQFVHLFGCWEDWFDEEVPLIGYSKYHNLEPRSVLGVILTLYTFTEIYEFAARLAQENLFGESVHLSISLHGMKNRKLTCFEVGRHLFADYVCHIENIKREKEIPVEALLGNGHEIALDETLEIFKRFNWDSPSRDVFRKDQQSLLKGKF